MSRWSISNADLGYVGVCRRPLGVSQRGRWACPSEQVSYRYFDRKGSPTGRFASLDYQNSSGDEKPSDVTHWAFSSQAVASLRSLPYHDAVIFRKKQPHSLLLNPAGQTHPKRVGRGMQNPLIE